MKVLRNVNDSEGIATGTEVSEAIFQDFEEANIKESHIFSDQTDGGVYRAYKRKASK